MDDVVICLKEQNMIFDDVAIFKGTKNDITAVSKLYGHCMNE